MTVLSRRAVGACLVAGPALWLSRVGVRSRGHGRRHARRVLLVLAGAGRPDRPGAADGAAAAGAGRARCSCCAASSRSARVVLARRWSDWRCWPSPIFRGSPIGCACSMRSPAPGAGGSGRWRSARCVWLVGTTVRDMAPRVRSSLAAPAARSRLSSSASASPIFVAAAWRLVPGPLYPGGDEPHYLVITQSLLTDHDLAIENNHARGDYLAYYQAPLKPDYRATGRDRRDLLDPPGRHLRAHCAGLRALAAIAAPACSSPCSRPRRSRCRGAWSSARRHRRRGDGRLAGGRDERAVRAAQLCDLPRVRRGARRDGRDRLRHGPRRLASGCARFVASRSARSPGSARSTRRCRPCC